jgi:hypothetical protein
MKSAPVQRVVVHVGTPKTGSTYLQDTMWESQAALLDAGVLYPGDHRASHFWATVDLKNDGYADPGHPAVPGAWARIVDAARAHRGTTVISHELLGDRSAEDVERVMADLDFAEVHVVATARNLERQLPSAWQEDLKNRQHVAFADWLDAVRAEHPQSGYARTFWLRQDLPSVLRRWRAALPPERVHLVTVPPSTGDASILWTRFATILGVHPAVVRLPESRRNKSLGWVEAEFLRRLNERAAYSIASSQYQFMIIGYLVQEVLAQRPGAMPIRLPAAERGWVSTRADAMISELAEAGYHIVGDLEELRVDAADAAPGMTPAISDTQVLDAALDAIVAACGVDPPAREAAADLRPAEGVLRSRQLPLGGPTIVRRALAAARIRTNRKDMASLVRRPTSP